MMQQQVINDYALLKKQYYWLNISFRQCNKIGIKENYEIEEFGYFETLCARYSRSMDFLIRKMFRTLDAYEFENQGSLIDTVNNAHKRGLFENIDELRIMKDIRNTIAHEYIEDNLVDTFEEVLKYSSTLMDIMNNTITYIDKIKT